MGNYRKVERFDSFGFVARMKAEGRIRHIGFSFHDSAELLDRILTEHPETEFVQLQINYLDWENETIQSRKCYEVARRHGKPIVVMEPLKGARSPRCRPRPRVFCAGCVPTCRPRRGEYATPRRWRVS